MIEKVCNLWVSESSVCIIESITPVFFRLWAVSVTDGIACTFLTPLDYTDPVYLIYGNQSVRPRIHLRPLIHLYLHLQQEVSLMNSSSSFTDSARRRGSSGQSCKTGLSRADVSLLDQTTELPSQNSPRAGNGAGVSDIPCGRIHFMLRQCKLRNQKWANRLERIPGQHVMKIMINAQCLASVTK